MAKLSNDMGIARKTLRLAVYADLRLQILCLEELSIVDRKNKADPGMKFLALVNDFKRSSAGSMRSFSHEHSFIKDGKASRKNDRWLFQGPSKEPNVMHSKCPPSVPIMGVRRSKRYVFAISFPLKKYPKSPPMFIATF